jgi:hypothetical protein
MSSMYSPRPVKKRESSDREIAAPIRLRGRNVAPAILDL